MSSDVFFEKLLFFSSTICRVVFIKTIFHSLPGGFEKGNCTGHGNIEAFDHAHLWNDEITVALLQTFLADALMFVAKKQGKRLREIEIVQLGRSAGEA